MTGFDSSVNTPGWGKMTASSSITECRPQTSHDIWWLIHSPIPVCIIYLTLHSVLVELGRRKGGVGVSKGERVGVSKGEGKCISNDSKLTDLADVPLETAI